MVSRVPSAYLRKDGKAVVDIGQQIQLKSFVETLPAHKYAPKQRKWTVAATPMTADRLSGDFEICDGLRVLASRFEKSSLLPSGDQIGEILYKNSPRNHQRSAVEWGLNRYASVFQMWMGTGKSFVAVTLAATWHDVRRVIILCPKAVRGVWRREFEKHCPVDYEIFIPEKKSDNAKKKAEKIREFLGSGSSHLKIVVVNYKSAITEALQNMLCSEGWDLCICDESHRVKSHSSKVSKMAYKLGQKSHRRVALTGTMIPHSLFDIYGQMRYIEPAVFGTSFIAYRNRYAITHPEYKNQVQKWINQDELTEKLKPWVYRVGSEVLDLPPKSHADIPVQLEPKTKKTYKKLKDELIAEIDHGEIVAANAMVKTLRLRQITGGSAALEDGTNVVIGNEKELALHDLIESMPRDASIVVFAAFKHDLRVIKSVTEKLDRRYTEVSGSRNDLTSHATMPDYPQVMGVQETSGGTGVDLTAAQYCIWYSLTYSLGDFDQAVARIHRPGQEKPTFFYHLVAEGTIDKAIYRAISKRREVADEILSHLKGYEDE